MASILANNRYSMSTLFIADLHLCPERPAITVSFLRFLRNIAIHSSALYILGDLFNSWSGDDDPEPLYSEIATALKWLQKVGVPCYFIHGNRDFLLASRFACTSGLQLLPQETVLTLYGRHILILHGDTLCTDDQIYQKFRQKARNPLIQKLFLSLPLHWRLQLASSLRARSQKTNQCKPECIMDVNPKAVERAMLYHGVHWMIHGHTHRPAVHRIHLKNGEAKRAVLGAWHFEGSMIKVNADAVELILFPL